MIETRYHATKRIFFMLVALGIGLLPGCVHKNKLKREPVTYGYSQEQEGVKVSVEMMTADQMSETLGANFFNYGFVPLVLTIDNQTTDALLVRGQSVHIPLENPYKVAQSAHYSTALLTTYSAYLSCLFFWPALLPSLGAGVYMSQANAAITQNVCSRGLASDGSVDVLPCEQISKILFVPANAFTSNFRMQVFNVHAKSFIPFTIKLGATLVAEAEADAMLTSLAA